MTATTTKVTRKERYRQDIYKEDIRKSRYCSNQGPDKETKILVYKTREKFRKSSSGFKLGHVDKVEGKTNFTDKNFLQLGF